MIGHMNTAQRTYFIITAVAITLLGLIHFDDSGGSPLTLLVFAPAILGLLFKSASLPMAFILLLMWCAVYPTVFAFNKPIPIVLNRSHFRIDSLLYLATITIYIVAHYRYLTVKTRAFPAEAEALTPTKTTYIRKANKFETEELIRTGLVIIAALVAASLLWLVVTSFTVEPLEVPPFTSKNGNAFDARGQFLILAAIIGSVMLFAGFIVSYTVAAKRSQIWGKQFMMDTAWQESRRELNRQEKRRALAQGTIATDARAKHPKMRGSAISLRGQIRTLFYVLTITFGILFIVAIFTVTVISLFFR